MDPFTHALLGVAVGENTFRRRIGRSANWLAALAALSPDLDVLAHYVYPDPWTSMMYHRGATHSLLVAPLLALAWAAIFWAFRRRQFWAMYALALLAVVSHPLLDLLTSYGTQLFWPISHQRFGLDVLPIVDIFFTPILLATVIGCAVVRRFARKANVGQLPSSSAVLRPEGLAPHPCSLSQGERDNRKQPGAAVPHSEFGLRPNGHPGAAVLQSGSLSQGGGDNRRQPRAAVLHSGRLARIGLLLAMLYAAWGGWIDYRATALARDTAPLAAGRAGGGVPLAIVRARAVSVMGNIFARRLVVQVPDGFYVARYNWLRSSGRPKWTWAPSDDGRFVEQADRLPNVQLFRWFAMGMARPVVDLPNDGQGDGLVRVTYYDMRYGYPADAATSIFAAYVILRAATGEVVAGPVSPRWSSHEQSPDGVAAHFAQPANPLNVGAGRWGRLKSMWHEAWAE